MVYLRAKRKIKTFKLFQDEVKNSFNRENSLPLRNRK